MKVAPSILAADFGCLNQEVQSLCQAGADWLHVDVMDGVFVPNLSLGLPIVKAIYHASNIPLDVHLMIVQPEKYLEAFIEAGSKMLTIHVEATRKVQESLKKIRQLGARAGISLRPGTPVETLLPFLELVDLVLVMTVEPGFGGQSFMKDQLEKIQWLYEFRETHQYPFLIQVDGGINAETAPLCRLADSLVSGTFILKAPNRKEAILQLKQIQ